MLNIELLTAKDVAGILKISEASIDNWHYGRKTAPFGFPPGVKIGACIRWRSSDIQRFISGLPFTTTGSIPTPDLVPRISVTSVVLSNPIRGRGRPRKIPVNV